MPRVLCAFIALMVCLGSRANAQILLPPPPKPVPPPPRSKDQPDQDLERLREHRRNRERETSPPPPDPTKVRNRALLDETLKPRVRGMMMEAALVGGTVVTTGDRQGYTAEPTVHFHLIFRHRPTEHDGRIGPWYGFRLAPFSGSGIYRGHHGDYGSLHFGPMVGVGKLDPVPGDVGGEGRAPESVWDLPTATGWLVTGGISAMTRIGGADPSVEDEVQEEFGSKGVTIDPPGIWLEMRYLRVLFGATGLDIVAGLQQGRGKTFYWAGIGAAAWR